MDISYIVYSFPDGRLGCFHLLAITNTPAVNIHVQVFVQIHVSVLLLIYSKVKLVDQMVTVLSFRRICKTFPQWLYHVTFPPAAYVPVSPFPCQHLLLFFIQVILVDVMRHLVVGLICISLMTNDVEHLSMCLLAVYLYFFFGEMSLRILCSF